VRYAAGCYFKDDYDKSVELLKPARSKLRVPKRTDTVAKAVGRRIRLLRMARQWSQERLADESGMHRTYMWGIEQGVRNPSLRHLARLADALNVELSSLFEGL
jgi:ribosome-binding protein aMBF1 (putative translation factor)